LLRGGTNVVAIHVPPTAGQPVAVHLPAVEVRGLGRSSGSEKKVTRVSAWKSRADESAPELAAPWIRGSSGGDAPGVVNGLPTGADATLLRAPVGVRAVLDVPSYWRNRSLSLLLHEVPGSPAVFLNGERLTEALQSPARIDLDSRFRFDGRDTLTLVWPNGPADVSSGWGIAALHWSPTVVPPNLPQRAVLGWEPGAGATQPGARQALAFASQILTLSATTYAIAWTGTDSGAAGVVVAAWSGTSFRGSDLAAVRAELPARLAAVRGDGKHPVWIMTPPTVSKNRNGNANSRLLEHDKELIAIARNEGAHVVPVFEVFNSALRRQKLWPTRPEWTDGTGTLTPLGAYLTGLVLVDALSLK
jgi:hypothetical protein